MLFHLKERGGFDVTASFDRFDRCIRLGSCFFSGRRLKKQFFADYDLVDDLRGDGDVAETDDFMALDVAWKELQSCKPKRGLSAKPKMIS